MIVGFFAAAALAMIAANEPPCGSTVCSIDALPKIGSVDSRSCATRYNLGTDIPGENYLAREASVNGVFYRIGTDRGGHVRYISTSDDCFRTPEGVVVGTTLSRIQKRFPTINVRTEGGWAHFVTLPSGWRAGFRGSEKKSSQIRGDEKVRYFFFR